MEWITKFEQNYYLWLREIGFNSHNSILTIEVTQFIISLLVFIILDTLFTKYGRRYIKKLISRTKTNADDIFFQNKVFAYLLHIIAAYIWFRTIDLTLDRFNGLEYAAKLVTKLWIVYLFIRGAVAFLNSMNLLYESKQQNQGKSVKSYIQVIQLLTIIIGVLVAISIIVSEDIGVLLTGLGAFAAVLMLVFKDSILGFVGGIQINANDLLRVGDWVTVASAEADGIVTDISLTTVKIQNWDRTISTIPTYSLVSGSFQNWRGMEESGGRRIKRSIMIDMNSIRFADKKLINQLIEIPLLKSYLENKEAELIQYNAQDESFEKPLRAQTNIGIFRAYVSLYLEALGTINTEMPFFVRQLQASQNGLPIEIYVFSTIKTNPDYEQLQSDIFDHLFAILHRFDLNIFQSVSGADLREISTKVKS